jgi:Methyltransferase domain
MIKLFNAQYRSSVNQHFREKRFRFFREVFAGIPQEGTIRILDVGGTESYWQNMNFNPGNVHITLLNLYEDVPTLPYFTSMRGSATDLSQFADKEFDLVHSNSVIEHLFTREAQQQMAKEVRRVGKRYYVQTPNRYFPVEPHWVFPFFQFLPVSLRVYLTRKYYLDDVEEKDRQRVAVERVNEVKLLTEEDVRDLFPDARIYREVFLGLTKSITAYRC